MPEYLFWHILILAGTGLFSMYWLLQGRHHLFARELCRRFSGKELRSYGSIWHWKIVVLQFWVRKKQIAVEYRFRHLRPKHGRTFIRWQMDGELEVRIPLVQKFWLRLLQQDQDEAPSEDIVTEIPQLDKRYVIHATQTEAATSFLKTPVVQDRLLRFTIFPDRLEVYKGFLRAVFNQPYRQQIRREEFENVVHILLDLVDVYENQQLNVFQIMPAAGIPTCPYCRGIFDPSREAIVKCSQCGTSLHEQCWEENQQCTTWGCASMIGDQNQNVILRE